MFTEKFVTHLSDKLQLSQKQVKAVLHLLEGGATVPFIARYRKEMTGSLDEVQIASIRDGMLKLKELDKRRTAILKSIDEQGKLSDILAQKFSLAQTITELEDLYLPYKPKKRTRATIAREKGLEGLAKIIMTQNAGDIYQLASTFVIPSNLVNDEEEALAGARDIMAEWVNENIRARDKIRYLFSRKAVVTSKVVKDKEQEGAKFRDYFNWNEKLWRMPSHRLLAILRGVNEGFLRLTIAPEEEDALYQLNRIFVKNKTASAEQVVMAVKDAYKRLMKPSIETEMRNEAKEKADVEAIKVFVTNLRELLMTPPLGQKRTMAIDPGYRTGCKVVCLDEQGKLIHNSTIYPHSRNAMQRFEAISAIEELVEKFNIEAIAIGNGTAGRETLDFIKKLGLENVQIVLVNESGASIYSASQVAREEFPDYDVTVRGSVSIGRRLMDPLAELVKIDPKSIGVGQYQHDVDQPALKQSLDDVVMSCVNAVGVEMNTASKQLLTYLSGIGPKLAQNIVEYRNENGAFTKKSQLKKVKGVGAKAFEQAAGFIRIRDAVNPLDASAVHPESYGIVKQMAADLKASIYDLVENESLRKQIDLKKYLSEKVGLPTLKDILAELAKPGRDPREQFENVQFAEGINDIDDLEEGMILPGIVTNVTNFGAFVDVGVKESGLVHVSEIANRFVKDPKQELRVNQRVKVKVVKLDKDRKRIGLSIKQAIGK